MTDLATTEAILATLIRHPTVSRDSNRALVDWIANRLEDMGASVEVLPNATGDKANLWATLGPPVDGGLVLSGHTDVVPVDGQDWSVPAFDLTVRDDLLLGRGTCDMKGFLAAVLATAPLLAGADLRHPVHIAFTHDEEVGCLGARALVETLAARGLRPATCIVGEPTGMRLVDGHKGCFEYTTRFTGLEGHGSDPDAGLNAVECAVRFARKLMDLAEAVKQRAPSDSPFSPPWTTINIGRLAGGAVHNIIPGAAAIDWEMRPVQAEDAAFVHDALGRFVADTLLPDMRAHAANASVDQETIGEVAGLEPRQRNAARDMAAQITGQNGVDRVAFGTEAGLFQGLGMDVVICGPGHIAQAHKPDEFLARSQLQTCLRFLTGLGRTLLR